jgi:BAG domain
LHTTQPDNNKYNPPFTVASSFLSSISQYLGFQSTTQHQSAWPEQLLPPIIRYLAERKTAAPSQTITGYLQNISYALYQELLETPAILPTIICTVLLTLTLLMSWSSRLGGWAGRFSPFASPSPTTPAQVTDQDFSYITSEDIARAAADSAAKDAAKSSRPHRETDAILLKHRKVQYPVHFPAYSINDGELTIGAIRKSAAKKVELPEGQVNRVKLFYRGKNLKDDARTAREEGMRSDSQPEILLVVGEPIVVRRPDDENGEEEEEDDEPSTGGKKKKRNRRKKKSPKTSTGAEDLSRSSTATSPPLSDATFAPGTKPLPKAAPTQAPKAILTPLQKLDTLATLYQETFVPQCDAFIAHPPEDETKRTFEHKKLTEMILAQVLLKLDAVETDGDDAARQRRKELVRETQGMLGKLDAVVKT